MSALDVGVWSLVRMGVWDVTGVVAVVYVCSLVGCGGLAVVVVVRLL